MVIATLPMTGGLSPDRFAVVSNQCSGSSTYFAAISGAVPLSLAAISLDSPVKATLVREEPFVSGKPCPVRDTGNVFDSEGGS